MAEKRVMSMAKLVIFFKDSPNQLVRGENSYYSGNVSSVLFDPEVQPALLKGEVKASMKNRSYAIELSLDEDTIIDASCSCPRGQVICHHIAAVCFFAYHNISVTDQACTWNAPKKQPADEKIQKIEDIFKPKEYCAVKRRATEEEIKKFINKLEEPVGFSWLLKPEPSDECLRLIADIEDIVFSEEYSKNKEKGRYFKTKLSIGKEVILKIAEATKGQYKNENWLVCRKHRLTASHFGAVLSACARNKYPESLFKTLIGGYDLEHVKAIQWGKENENEALNMFQIGMKLEVQPTGLWLHECGYLGASPDGLIGDNGLLEIKCPYKFRNGDLEEALASNKDYIIYKDERGDTKINEKHNYWHQIQGQLHITKRKTCYLMVWTPMKMEVIAIDRSEEWSLNIDILQKFFIEKYLMYIS